MKYLLILILLMSCGNKNSTLYPRVTVPPKNEKPINDVPVGQPEEISDDVIFMVANGDNTLYSPYLLDNRNQVFPVGIGDQWTECYNGFELKGNYYCGAYDNSNGNLDWSDSMMIKINPQDPSQTERAFDINGTNGDDGISYKSRFLKNDKVWFLANWGSDLYSWDGVNNPQYIGNLTSTSDIWELGDYLYFYDNSGVYRVNTINSVVETLDFSNLNNITRVTLLGVDQKSNKLIVNLFENGTDISTYIVDPKVMITSSDIEFIATSGTVSDSQRVAYAGSTDDKIYFIRDQLSSTCTGMCDSSLMAFDKNTKVFNNIQTEAGTRNVQAANNDLNYRNPQGAIVEKKGDLVYLSMVSENMGTLILEYNEQTDDLREVFELDFIVNEYHKVDELIYLVTRNQKLYVTDLNTVSFYPNMIVDTGFVLNNYFYAILEPLNGDRELYRLENEVPLLFHEFTSDNTDPEFWTDPIGLPILK